MGTYEEKMQFFLINEEQIFNAKSTLKAMEDRHKIEKDRIIEMMQFMNMEESPVIWGRKLVLQSCKPKSEEASNSEVPPAARKVTLKVVPRIGIPLTKPSDAKKTRKKKDKIDSEGV